MEQTEERTIISLRIPRADERLIKRVAKSQGMSMSAFIRRSVRRELAELSYYPAEVKKALGVRKEPQSINGAEGVT